MNDVRLVKFDLAKLMRAHGVTIRELSARMGVPMTRVRAVRAMGRVHYMVYCDYVQSVTGSSVFSRARWEAMQRASA